MSTTKGCSFYIFVVKIKLQCSAYFNNYKHEVKFPCNLVFALNKDLCSVVDGHTWWIHEIEVHEVVDAQLFQLQHHGAQIRTQDFWICVILKRRA